MTSQSSSNRSGGNESPRMTRIRNLRAAAILLAAALCASGCQAYMQQQQAKREVLHKLVVAEDRGRIVCYTGTIDEPHEKLGEVSYTEPLNATTIDTHHINSKLRDLALARFGNSVDAIIHIKTKVGGTTTTTISVKGEAVEVKSNAPGWHHVTPMAPPI
jgi:hypothetical protein